MKLKTIGIIIIVLVLILLTAMALPTVSRSSINLGPPAAQVSSQAAISQSVQLQTDTYSGIPSNNATTLYISIFCGAILLTTLAVTVFRKRTNIFLSRVSSRLHYSVAYKARVVRYPLKYPILT